MPIEPPVISPRTLADAYPALEGARPIAGGTDLMVALTGELGEPPERIVDLWGLDELRGIAIDGDAVVLGALTTYTEIRRSAVCREHLPGLVEAAATIGAAQIQNRGTLGGNAANASPAGDTLPVLLAMDASFVLGSARGERTVPGRDVLAELSPDGPRPRRADPAASASRSPPGREVRFRKVGTRRAQSISKVVMALAWRERVTSTRRSPGAGATFAWPSGPWRPPRSVPARPRACSRAGRRRPRPRTSPPRPSPASSHPIDDVRSTAEYRRLVAARVLHRLIREVGGW